MAVDKKEIRKALDNFEDENYVDAKEILKKQVIGSKEDFLQKKLGLKDPITPKPEKGDDKKGEE